MWLFLLFVAIPILEIALFIQVGGFIGLWPTLAIVVLTALVGTIMVRSQGFLALERLRRAIGTGQDPVGPIAHGALILVAGVLLLTPGFFTDAVGLSLLVPPVRSAVIGWGAARLAGRITTVVQTRETGPGPGPGRGSGPIEAEYEVIDDDPRAGEPPVRGSSGWTRPGR